MDDVDTPQVPFVDYNIYQSGWTNFKKNLQNISRTIKFTKMTAFYQKIS